MSVTSHQTRLQDVNLLLYSEGVGMKARLRQQSYHSKNLLFLSRAAECVTFNCCLLCSHFLLYYQ